MAAETDKGNPSFGVYIDQLARAGIFVLGSLYTVGLLIVNINLGQYGIFHVEFARPEYILVGALWAFLIILTAATLHLIVSKIKHTNAKAIAILNTTVVCTSVLFSYLYILWIISGGRLYVIEQTDWSVNWTGVLAVLALIFNVMSPWRLVSHFRRTIRLKERHFKNLSADDYWNLLYYLALSFSVFGLYATIAYPLLPRAIGGGNKPFVTLFLTERLPHDALKDHLPISADAKIVGPVRLIFETDKMFLIKRGYSQTIFEGLFSGERDWPVVGIDKSRATILVYHRRTAMSEKQ